MTNKYNIQTKKLISLNQIQLDYLDEQKKLTGDNYTKQIRDMIDDKIKKALSYKIKNIDHLIKELEIKQNKFVAKRYDFGLLILITAPATPPAQHTNGSDTSYIVNGS